MLDVKLLVHDLPEGVLLTLLAALGLNRGRCPLPCQLARSHGELGGLEGQKQLALLALLGFVQKLLQLASLWQRATLSLASLSPLVARSLSLAEVVLLEVSSPVLWARVGTLLWLLCCELAFLAETTYS